MEIPNIVYFRNNNQTHLWKTKLSNVTLTYPRSWSELSKELESGNKYLAVHADILNSMAEPSLFMDAITTITNLMPGSDDVRVAVVITPVTSTKFIKELQKSSCQGIILDIDCYPEVEVLISINAFIHSIPYWPKNIISKLPGAVKRENNDYITELTTRQAQVLQLVKERGASNKMIAKTLGITESTVKLHMGVILKKFNVKNRTQLVAFSKD